FTRYARIAAPLPGAPGNTAWLGRIHLMDGEGQGQGMFIGAGGDEFCHPAWAPDGSAVYFSSSYASARSSFLMDIFRADLRTGVVQRITGAEWSAGPVKGFGRLAVVVDTGTAGIDDYFGILDPKNEIKITYNGANGKIFHLTQNLQDRKGNDIKYRWVAFIDHVPAGHIWVRAWRNKHIGGLVSPVVVVEGKTSDVQIDLSSGNFLAHYPSVSPDGRYLVFRQGVAYYRRPAANAFGSDKIAEDGYDTMAVLDMQAPLRTLLAQWDAARMGGKAVDPRISPDGRTIAFSYGLTPTESIAVCSLESLVANQPRARVVAQGGRQLGNTLGHMHAAWSPDGRRLAFCRYMQVTEAWGTLFGGNLFVCNADGSGLRQVTQVGANQFPVWPTWSPDGRRIAFALLTAKGQRFEMLDLLPGRATSNIWTIGADGSDPRQLTQDGLSCEPAWGK
ncbi:MAG TPA: hypothetical protein P5137_16530, partial [Candidatus Brocadiia bacterium]|nr:hypothetical protein [Candidatus Brocadiia bacterium]